jgi:AcrR family transcriptional regulator
MRADARRNYERIVSAARTAFAEHGPDASLDDIARRADVGPGTLYRHFPTRLALQEAVIRDNMQALSAQANELLSAADPGAALASWLRAKLRLSMTDRGLGAAVETAMLCRQSAFSSSCMAMTQAAEALLARAQAAGAIRADVDVTSLLRLMNALALAIEQAPDSAAEADRLLTLVLDGLRAETASRKSEVGGR